MPPRKAAVAATPAKAAPVRRRRTPVVEHDEMISKVIVDRDFVSKDELAKVAKRYKERHGWCDEVDSALAEMGVVDTAYTEAEITVKFVFKARHSDSRPPPEADVLKREAKNRLEDALSEWLDDSEYNVLDYHMNGFAQSAEVIEVQVKQHEATVTSE